MRSLLAVAALLLGTGSPGVLADYTLRPALGFSTPTELQLLDVVACDNRLLAVGERGAIIYSDDNGSTWQQAEVPVSQTLTAVTCATASDKRWAVGHGGVILASEDGGINWRTQLDGNQVNQQWLDYKKRQLAELEATVASLPGEQRADLALDLEDAAFAIEDAEGALAAGPVDPFLDIYFRDAFNGLAVGAYGMLYRTRNGGVTWELSVTGIDNPDRYHYYAITAAGNALFLAGEAGVLYRSRDQGETWETLDPGYAGSLFGLLATDTDALLVFGLRGNILRSDDAGNSWRYVNVMQDPRLSLYDGARLSNGRMVLIGAAGVRLSSTDGGETFAARTDPARSTVAAVTEAPSGDVVLAGLDGLALVPGHSL